MSNPLTPESILTLVFSGGALALSIFTFFINFRWNKKTYQTQLASDLSNRLYQLEKDLLEINKEFNKELASNEEVSEDYFEGIQGIRKIIRLQIMNVFEFFAFLVNNGGISDEGVIEHYKPRFVSSVKAMFKDYSDIYDDKTKFEEIRRLLDKWDKEKKS